MARVVGVHGAFHELWGPNELAARWLPAVRDGLWHADTELATDDFGVAFYGDLFRHAPDAEPTDAELEDLARNSGLLDVARQVQGAGGLEALAAAVGKETLHRMLDQAGRYIADPSTRVAVRARVERSVTPDTRVIVAHSLGTVVAYEALCAHPEWGVTDFLTIGSPLGADGIVFEHLDPPPVDGLGAWPGSVVAWTNVAAIGDMACAHPKLADRFGPRVTDLTVDNGHRAHDPEPYLNAAVTGHAVAAGLARADR
jgi:hypothetical protein